MWLNAWVADKFPMLIWLVSLLRMLCAVLSLSNLQITLALWLLLSFFTIEYLYGTKCSCVHGRPIIFHFIICLFYLLYHNITSQKSLYGTIVYYLLFVKWNLVFTLRNSDSAKTWPTRLSAMALIAMMIALIKVCFLHQRSKGWKIAS